MWFFSEKKKLKIQILITSRKFIFLKTVKYGSCYFFWKITYFMGGPTLRLVVAVSAWFEMDSFLLKIKEKSRMKQSYVYKLAVSPENVGLVLETSIDEPEAFHDCLASSTVENEKKKAVKYRKAHKRQVRVRLFITRGLRASLSGSLNISFSHSLRTTLPFFVFPHSHILKELFRPFLLCSIW